MFRFMIYVCFMISNLSECSSLKRNDNDSKYGPSYFSYLTYQTEDNMSFDTHRIHIDMHVGLIVKLFGTKLDRILNLEIETDSDLDTIEEDRICSAITNRKLKLKQNEAILVTITRSKDHKSPWHKNLRCTFQIEAASEIGIFAVVQKVNFRHNATTNQCVDYVQFRSKKTGSSSLKICRNTNILEAFDPEMKYSPLSFADKDGKLDTSIFISKDQLYPYEETELIIVFTSFRSCYRSDVPCYDGRCISSAFVHDGYVNCPNVECALGGRECDETSSVLQHWSDNDHVTNSNVPTLRNQNITVTLSAMASLVISFLVFIVCCWFCKKTGKLCFAADCMQSTSSAGQRTQSSRVIEMQNRPEGPPTSTNAPAPSAPDLSKDQPPSYDSLFPATGPTNNT